MSARVAWIGGALVVGAAVAGVAAMAWLGEGTDVPTLEIRKGSFVRRIVAEGNLEAVEATPITGPSEAEGPMKVAWLVADGSRVTTGEVLMRFDPTDMEKLLEDGRADRVDADSRIEGLEAQSRGTIRNLERDADLARRELEFAGQFQSKDPTIFSRSQIIESEIDSDLARDRMERARAVRAVHERLAEADLALLRIERRKADIKIGRAGKALDALEVKAPHDGIVVYKRDWRGNTTKVGDTVWSGEPIAEIPRLDTMQARVFVLEADAGGLTKGLPATIALESRPDTRYTAKVKHVDNLARRRVGWVPVQYFAVTLELESTDPAVMKPGQRLQATLKLDERGEALAVPRGAVFEKEGKTIVYRRARGAFEPVEVTLGPSAVGRVVVESGIADGDVIALRDPTRPLAAGESPGAAPPAAPQPGARP